MRLRLGIVVQTLVLGLLIPACGATRAERSGDDIEAAGESDAVTDDDILFRAIEDVFSQREVPVEIVSRDKQIIIGRWVELNSEVRRRLVGRVVRANAGLVLRVRAEYQRLDRSGAAAVWQPADDPLTARKAQREEQQLGHAIQTRFRELRKR